MMEPDEGSPDADTADREAFDRDAIKLFTDEELLVQHADGGPWYRLEYVTTVLAALPATDQEGLFSRPAELAAVTDLSPSDLKVFSDCQVFQPACCDKEYMVLAKALYHAPQKTKSAMARCRNVAIVLGAAGYHGLPAQIYDIIRMNKKLGAEDPISAQRRDELKARIEEEKAERDWANWDPRSEEWRTRWVRAVRAYNLYKMGPVNLGAVSNHQTAAVSAHHYVLAGGLLAYMKSPQAARRRRPAQPPPREVTPSARTTPRRSLFTEFGVTPRPSQPASEKQQQQQQPGEPSPRPGGKGPGASEPRPRPPSPSAAASSPRGPSRDAANPRPRGPTPTGSPDGAERGGSNPQIRHVLTAEEHQERAWGELQKEHNILNTAAMFPNSDTAKECREYVRERNKQYRQKLDSTPR